MMPIATADGVRVGDVLHHPALGFATVTGVDDRGASLKWAQDGNGLPGHASRHVLETSYRRCAADGWFALRASDAARAERVRVAAPLTVLGRILVDLGGVSSRSDLREWFVGGEIWVDGLMELAGADPRFTVTADRVGLTEAVDLVDFPLPADVASAEHAPADPPVAPAGEPPPPPQVETQGEGVWELLTRLSRVLASQHAVGRSIQRLPDLLVTREGELRLDPDPDAPFDPRADVAFLLRAVLNRVAGPLLSPQSLPDPLLVQTVGVVAPELPPELLAVALRSLARSPQDRYPDGTALWGAVQVARTVAELRETAPMVHRAEIRVGFDTHIGTMKSLLGQTNQDAFVLAGNPELALFCVADGISTATAGSGDLASMLLARTLGMQWASRGDTLERAGSTAIKAFLRDALDRANTVVCETAVRIAGGNLGREIPMGTTVVAGISRGNTVHLAALGDSRAWIVGRHGVAPLLAEHNVHSMRLRDGLEGEPEEDGSALTSYIGHYDPLGRPTLGAIYWRSFALLPEEWLILATDGLSDYLADDEAGVARRLASISARVEGGHSGKGAMALARDLVRAANDGGGGDNVTVLALTLGTEPGGGEDAGPVSS